MKRCAYNLEFPPYCDSLTIQGYIFKRVQDYPAKFKSLHHTFHINTEFGKFRPALGTHALTAHITLPNKEDTPVIAWVNDKEKPTALDDVVLLLSLFTGRDVFHTPKPIDDGNCYTEKDPRRYGLDLRLALPEKRVKISDSEPYERDKGFAQGINAVYQRMCSPHWREQYDNGRFLPLYNSSCKRQMLESAVITCWTIWEHLFFLHNRAWLSEEQIRLLPLAEKLSYVLIQYHIKEALNSQERKGLKRFVTIRNILIHSGRFTDRQAIDDAVLFVYVTRMIIARILGLSHPDTLGYLSKFSDRLIGKQ